MSDHAFVPPSSLGVIVHCTYYPYVNRDYPTPDTMATLEGEAAHSLIESGLNEFRQTGSTDIDFDKWDNTPAENGVYITSEMIGHVKDSFDHMVGLVKNQCNFDTMHIEGRVQMPQLHPTDCWGTLDFGFYDHATRKITIRDFKYGFGLVNEIENYQLFAYFLGMMVKYPEAEYFDLGVCQPRPFHRLGNNRNWVGHIGELEPMMEFARQSISAIYTNPVTKSGDHCRYCQVNYKCDAFIKSTMNAIDIAVPPNINEVTNDQLFKLYSVIERAANSLKHARESISNTITAKIDSGERIPGLMIASKMGNSKWAVNDKKAIELCELIGITDVGVTKAKTPISVLNSLGKNDSRRKTVESYLKRTQSSTSLIFDDGREADRVFGKQ